MSFVLNVEKNMEDWVVFGRRSKWVDVIFATREQKLLTLKLMALRSTKPVKSLEEVLLPYQVTFPVDVEGSVNVLSFKFRRNEPSEIKSYEIYEALAHSSYGKYFEG